MREKILREFDMSSRFGYETVLPLLVQGTDSTTALVLAFNVYLDGAELMILA